MNDDIIMSSSMHPQLYDGITPTPSGSTAFGYFDNDVEFIRDAPSTAKSIAYKLGYPVLDVELTIEQMYKAFEDAIMVYGAEVNKYNIKENLLNVQGGSTTQSLTQKNISTSLNRITEISDEYGIETYNAGNITYHKGYITTVAGQQIYDLDILWANANGYNDNEIIIKRVFHQNNPAIFNYNQLGDFGWNQNSNVGVRYLLTPIFDDLLHIQQLEFNNTVRRSSYSFRVQNNKLQLFPIPADSTRIWFEYIFKFDKTNPLRNYPSGSISSGSLADNVDQISDYSNIPYDIIPYAKINSVGRSWIREYTFASCKEILGGIRSKYGAIPTTTSDISLDGDTLRSEGENLKQELIDNLRDTLESTSRKMQMDAKREESESLNEILNHVPLKIYIG